MDLPLEDFRLGVQGGVLHRSGKRNLDLKSDAHLLQRHGDFGLRWQKFH